MIVGFGYGRASGSKQKKMNNSAEIFVKQCGNSAELFGLVL